MDALSADADVAKDRRLPQIQPSVAGLAGFAAAETIIGSADLHERSLLWPHHPDSELSGPPEQLQCRMAANVALRFY